MNVSAYRNLHRRCWSVLAGGRVREYPERLVLAGVTFKVRESGRRRVLAEGRKNVHAFVRGTPAVWSEVPPDAKRVRYNPNLQGSFFLADTGEPVHQALRAWLTESGQVFVAVAEGGVSN